MQREYVAKRLPAFAGRAAWNAILGAPPPPEPLEGEVAADFVVVGAGFAGLSAARRLVQLNPGAKIVVLDATRVGEGGAGRNSGFMIDLPHNLTSENYVGTDKSQDRNLIDLNRIAIEFAREAVEEYGIDRGFFDPAGKINGAASESSHAQNETYGAHLRELNERYEMLDEQAMFKVTGSRHYLSGLYTPGTVMLQPAGYVRGWARGIAGQVAIHENSPVTAFRRQAGNWRVETPKGAVSTAKIILANNGQIESFGISRGRLMHIFLFACMTEELDRDVLRRLGGYARWGITPSDPMGSTIRRTNSAQGGNRICIRTCAEFSPDMKSTDGKLRRAAAIMRRKFDERFPQIRGVRMEYAWSGPLCLSKNGASITGEIDNGVYAACCQNGLGTTRGTLTGIAAAECASGHSSVITAFFSSQAKPSLLPPEPMAKLGATAYLNWKGWRARNE